MQTWGPKTILSDPHKEFIENLGHHLNCDLPTMWGPYQLQMVL